MVDQFTAFTGIDWIIVGVLVVSSLISIARGFVKEALSLATWFAAIVISRLFAGQVSSLLADTIDVPSVRLGAAYLLLIVGTLIVGALVNRLIGELVRMTGLSGTDRFLGMFFGLARGAVVVLVIVAGLYYLAPVEDDRWWKESILIPRVVDVIEWLGPLLWERGSELIDSTKAQVL